jgi:hypothetical protein
VTDICGFKKLLVLHVTDICGFKKLHTLDLAGVGGDDYILSIVL